MVEHGYKFHKTTNRNKAYHYEEKKNKNKTPPSIRNSNINLSLRLTRAQGSPSMKGNEEPNTSSRLLVWLGLAEVVS